jgi:hypothetical protein
MARVRTERRDHAKAVGAGRGDPGNSDPHCDPAGYVGASIPVAIVVSEGEESMNKKTRRRGRFLLWLRRVLYILVCEEASAKGEAALWSPFKTCWCCSSAIMANSRYCSSCGVSQSGKNTGPIKPVTPIPPELSVTDRMETMKKLGERPVKAYNRLYGGSVIERKEKQHENNR